MLTAIVRSLRTGVVTTRYPSEPAQAPERFRGAPRAPALGAFATLPPPSACPAGAISGGGAQPRYTVDLGRCVFCTQCAEEDSGPGRLEHGPEFELAARRRDALVVGVERDPTSGTKTSPAAPAGPDVADHIRRTLGRSLHLRHLDAGSCNGCDWELTALLNPFYDVRRLGIDFVASPRHADGVIVTGPVTRNLELAVRRTYEAVPDPRVVIAVGACATSGGVVGAGYASSGGVAEVLPVDVFIPGCPPRPEAIIFGILLAVGRVRERSR